MCKHQQIIKYVLESGQLQWSFDSSRNLPSYCWSASLKARHRPPVIRVERPLWMVPSSRCYFNNAPGSKHAITTAASNILTEKAKAECYEGNTLLTKYIRLIMFCDTYKYTHHSYTWRCEPESRNIRLDSIATIKIGWTYGYDYYSWMARLSEVPHLVGRMWSALLPR